MDVYYSNFSVSYPDYVYYLEFLPDTNSSQNVTPWGQTDDVPIYKITSYGTAKPINVTIYLNETPNDCITLQMGQTSGFEVPYNVNTTPYYGIISELNFNESDNIWLRLILDNCSGRWQDFYPVIISCCDTCNCGWAGDIFKPVITIIHPENGTTTYDSNFNFSYVERYPGCMKYSLDGKANVTNCTTVNNRWDGSFGSLGTYGWHNVTVWMNDTFGNENSEFSRFFKDTYIIGF